MVIDKKTIKAAKKWYKAAMRWGSGSTEKIEHLKCAIEIFPDYKEYILK